MTAVPKEALFPKSEKFRDEDAIEILAKMQALEWRVDSEERTDYHRHPVITDAADPENGLEYELRTDQGYLDTIGVDHYSDIPTLMYPDMLKGSWQVIPLLRINSIEDPQAAYFLFPNFDHRCGYQQGPGLAPRYVGRSKAKDGNEDVILESHRRVYGSEEAEFKATVCRLLETQPATSD